MDSLTKNAARAGLRRLREALTGAEKLEQQVAHSGAGRGVLEALQKHKSDAAHLMSDPNAIGMGRKLPFGSQLRVLGGGGEGMAQHVIRPGMGASEVLKIHEPNAGTFSHSILAQKDKMVGKEFPGVAKIHERTNMPGNHPAYFNEYVPGSNATVDQMKNHPEMFKELYHTAEHGVPGTTLLDVERRPGNVKMTSQGPKAIDFMPVDSRDVLPHAVRQQMPPNQIGAMLDHNSPTPWSFNHKGTAMPSTNTTIRQAYGRQPLQRVSPSVAQAPTAMPATAQQTPAATVVARPRPSPRDLPTRAAR